MYITNCFIYGFRRRSASRRGATRRARRCVCVCLWRRRCQRRRCRRRCWHPKIPYYYIDYKDAAMRRAKNKTHRRAALLISPPSWQICQFFFHRDFVADAVARFRAAIPRVRVADRSSVNRATRAFSCFTDAPYTCNIRLAIPRFPAISRVTPDVTTRAHPVFARRGK